ncbi:uncharacterized protein LOC142337266 [Convolutriloba macropyga]|uniref:uncharacterized protein LOC142337266 n=1 Tax=Convolutriloba macropyga TaxID=536237 RepID=UPI003F51D6B6
MKKENPADIFGSRCETSCKQVITPTLRLIFPCEFEKTKSATKISSFRTCRFPEIWVKHRMFKNHLLPYVLKCNNDPAQCVRRQYPFVAFFGNTRATQLQWTCREWHCQLADCKRDFQLVPRDTLQVLLKEAVKFFCNWDRSVRSMRDVKDILMEYYSLNQEFGNQAITFDSLSAYFRKHQMDNFSKLGWLHDLARAEFIRIRDQMEN